ncbi:MAG: hypothetical protein EOP92_16125 [Lysobacteraceae bacterium]|nr:MAG: hypothetical protein EOP92_16125 [Xanthomonadaceae bacterium]
MFSNKLMFFVPLAALASPIAAAQEAAQETPSQQGMVVVRDAETGQLRAPTSLEARALHARTNAAAARSAAPAPRMIIGPGGRRSVQLGERQMVYSVVTRDAEGKLAEQCVHGDHAAERAVQGAPQPGHTHSASTKPEEHLHENR